MVPQISINYNSQQGNGIVGYGWSIGGISAITHVANNHYFDGVADPSAPTAAYPKYALDGQRLLPQLNASGNVDQYFTENTDYGFVKMVSGPSWPYFRAVSKSGMISEFGATGDAAERPVNNASYPYVANFKETYLLNRISDEATNYIDFQYADVNNERVISEIKYTGNVNAGLAPYNSIRFYYGLRSDRNKLHRYYYEKEQNNLLERIEVIADGQIVRKYLFTYGLNDDGYSFLKEIAQQGANGGLINSTIFRSGDFSNGTFVKTALNSSARCLVADINGDGLTDVIQNNESVSNLCVTDHTGFNVYTGNGTSSSSLPLYGNLSMNAAQSIGGLNLGGGMYKPTNSSGQEIASTDFDGDGRDDIIRVETYIGGGAASYCNKENRTQKFTISFSGGNASIPFSTQTYFFPGFPNKEYEVKVSQFMQIADLDGDNLPEIVFCLRDPGNGYQPMLFLYSHKYSQVFSLNNASIAAEFDQAEQVFRGDYDGDGDVEFYVCRGGNIDVYSVTIAASSASIALKSRSTTPATSDNMLWMGDFNGDGLPDLLWNQSSNIQKFQIAFGNGAGFTAWQLADAAFASSSTPGRLSSMGLDLHNTVYTNQAIWRRDGLQIGDYNGDGKADILKEHAVKNNGIVTSNLEVYYSQGYNTWSPAYSYPLDFLTSDGLANAHATDMNGDNKEDMLVPDVSNTKTKVVSFRSGLDDHSVVGILNGVANLTYFVYTPLNGSAGNFANSHTYHGADLLARTIPVNGVARCISNSNLPGIAASTTDYTYTEPLCHRFGKGFVGFNTTTAKDVVQNKTVSTTTALSQIYTTGVIPRLLPGGSTTTMDVNGTVTSTDQTRTLYKQTPVPNVFVADSVWDIASDVLSGAITTTGSKYDNYANVIRRSVKYGNAETSTTSYVYVNNAGFNNPYPHKISSEIITTARTGGSPVTKQNDFYYFSNGWLWQTFEFANLTNSTATVYSYNNPFGNVDTKRRSAPGLTPKYTQYIYEPVKQRFVVEEINPLGNHEYTTYDSRWGVPTSRTNIAQNTTTYTYDEFGGLIASTLPSGETVTTTKSWRNSGNILFRTTTTGSNGGGLSFTEFDWLGRSLSDYTALSSRPATWPLQGMIPIYTIVDKTYDAVGNLSSETQPHTTTYTDPYLTTSHSYDSYNRLQSSCNYVGCTSYQYSYAGGKTTVTTTTPAGVGSSETSDEAGRLVSTQDAAGVTMTFTYDGWGNKYESFSSAQGAGAITRSTYDSHNNKVQEFESNAGTRSYIYDNLCRLTSETDARGITHTYTYDLIDRLLTKAGPEGTITNTYYNAANPGQGLDVQLITDFNGNTEQYTYTPYGKVASLAKTISGNTYNYSYTYDTWNRLKNTTYPTGLVITNGYNTYGNWISVMNGTTSLYSRGVINGMNQAKQTYLGNGDTYYSDYTYGLLSQKSSLFQIQNLQLNWDFPSGNLLERTDWIKSMTEQFHYDAADRLLDATVLPTGSVPTTATPQNVTYFPNGNIQAKTEVGGYAYGTKPHGVSYVTNAPGLIPTLQQDIIYTPFQRPSQIKQGTAQLDITYDQSYNRIGSSFRNGRWQDQVDKIYLPDGLEVHTGLIASDHIHYINGPEGVCAIYLQHTGSPDTWYFPYTDHLGSIVALTDINRNVVYERSFDAWGNDRNPADWSFNNVPINAGFKWLRGFTGHEHLPQLGLINMNARLYDPLLGRMLSPDNYVQDGSNSQYYNRYSYCANNPLRYTDPSGEVFGEEIVFGLIGGTVNLLSNLGSVHSFGQGAAFFGIGFAGGAAAEYITPMGAAAFVSAANAALGGYIKNGTVDPAEVVKAGVMGAATAGIAQGVSTALAPVADKLLPALAPAFRGAAVGAASGAAVGGVTAGISTFWTGGDFWSNFGEGASWGAGVGFVTGTYVAARQARANNINPWTGERILVPVPEPLPASPIRSLGAARTEIKEWLQTVGTIDESTLLQNITDAGFKLTSPEGLHLKVYENKGLKVRVDPPQKGTPYNHIHLEYGGQSYNTLLRPVPRKSPDAHIPRK
jgi:RHS repeat-associated protein